MQLAGGDNAGYLPARRRPDDREDRTQRHPSGARRAHGGFRRLGHADQLRLADRGASRGATWRRHVRRVAHDRGRPAWRAQPQLSASLAGQQHRQTESAGQGAVLVHAQRDRRGDRRLDRVLPGRRVLSPGGQCGNPRQGSGMDRQAGSPIRCRSKGTSGFRDDRRAGTAGACHGARPVARGGSPAYREAGQVCRCGGPGPARHAAVRGAHRLYR